MSVVLIQGASLNEASLLSLCELTGASSHQLLSPQAARLFGARLPLSTAAREFARRERLDCTAIPRVLSPGEFRLLAMDMDSTLITIECIDEIADMVGVKPEVKRITEAAMRGELVFAEALRHRVALLKGLDVTALDRVYEERLRLSPGAEALLAFAREAQWTTLLVSGGFTFFTDRLKARLGLDFTLANTLEVCDGRLTGRVLGDIVDGDAKAREVQRICQRIGCPTSAAVVAGDGANDLKMMALAGWSIAFHAKPVVQESASMAINFGGLDALLNVFERSPGPSRC